MWRTWASLQHGGLRTTGCFCGGLGLQAGRCLRDKKHHLFWCSLGGHALSVPSYSLGHKQITHFRKFTGRGIRLHLMMGMTPHSSTLAWKIPWMEEPGRLQSMGSQRVRHDWATSLSLFTFMHWRRKWQPTPVFLPGESQGRGSLVGCHLWGRTESDTTEAT